MRFFILFLLLTLSLSAIEWQRADLPGTRLLISGVVSLNGDIIIQDKSNIPLSFIYQNNGWMKLNDGFLDTLSRIYAIEQNDNIIFISSKNGNFYSSNYGDTWTSVERNGLTGTVSKKYYFGSGLNRQLFKFSFENEEWTLATYTNDSNNLDTLVGDLIECEGDLLASSEWAAFPLAEPGIRISTDGGETWYESPSFNKLIMTMEITDGVIYVMTTDKKLYFSEDNGMTWQATNAEELTINELVAYKGNLYSIMNDAAYKSSDNGNTWELFVDGVKDIVIENIKAVGGKLMLLTERSQLYFYSEESKKWEYQPFLDKKMSCDDLRVHRDTLFGLGGSRGILYSTNSGKSWFVYSDELSNEAMYYWDLQINDDLIVLSNNGQYITISDDSGLTWTTSGIGYFNPQAPPIREIQLRNDTIILFTTIGIKVSTNKGEEWVDYYGGDLNKGKKASNIFRTSNGYYIKNINGIYKSNGNFREWQLVLDSLESEEIGMGWIHNYTEKGLVYFNGAMVEDSNAVYSYSFDTHEKKLFCDYPNKDRAAYFLLKAESSYIMAYGSSVIVSHDEGISWEEYNLDLFGPDSLRGNEITRLIVKDNRLIASTPSGIAYADLSEFGIVTSIENETERNYLAYPNPATNTVNIDLTPHQFTKVNKSEIRVYDVIGNKLNTDGEIRTENNKVVWDCSTKPSGVYFIKINEEIYKVIKE